MSICRTNCRSRSPECAVAAVGPAVVFLELPVHQKRRNTFWAYALRAGFGTTAGDRVAVVYV